MYEGLGGVENICPVCGKRFLVSYPQSWVYKKSPPQGGSEKYYCSWTCYRKVTKRKKQLLVDVTTADDITDIEKECVMDRLLEHGYNLFKRKVWTVKFDDGSKYHASTEGGQIYIWKD